ncbi:TPA: hypothetical protein I7725_05415 [Vibrio vulnificus]|nr:hypothetical protein [Vibrio parahaemolyticus]HAS8310108.1 hypothetical protein [Vibrio vulnificus]HAS8553936.1 hypothetical protein [Vibrio vulnificus]
MKSQLNDDFYFRTMCPLCRKKLTLTNFENHRQCYHKNHTAHEFEQLVIHGLKKGWLKVKTFESGTSGFTSATEKLQHAKVRKINNFYRIKQGGKVSPR